MDVDLFLISYMYSCQSRTRRQKLELEWN